MRQRSVQACTVNAPRGECPPPCAAIGTPLADLLAPRACLRRIEAATRSGRPMLACSWVSSSRLATRLAAASLVAKCWRSRPSESETVIRLNPRASRTFTAEPSRPSVLLNSAFTGICRLCHAFVIHQVSQLYRASVERFSCTRWTETGPMCKRTGRTVMPGADLFVSLALSA